MSDADARSADSHHLVSAPDQHLEASVAAGYDRSVPERFSPEAIEPCVNLLAELAGAGSAVEFAVGTGRLALPLSGRGVTVHGIDFSEPMLAELKRKPGADKVSLTVGDMTETVVCNDASLVYLAFNTITNLRTQAMQVACFRNAAAHLSPDGRFVIENNVPILHRMSPSETVYAYELTPTHLGFDEYIDMVNQISVSHHYFIDGDNVRNVAGAFRYVWPSELDLMAELAGLEFESRWADWHRNEFTGTSRGHVSVWRKR